MIDQWPKVFSDRHFCDKICQTISTTPNQDDCSSKTLFGHWSIISNTMEDHEQCAARQQQLWEFHLCCLFYPSLLCSLHIWRHLSLGCHNQDSYVKSTFFLGVKKVFSFWEKQCYFKDYPFLSSPLQPIYISLGCHHQDSYMTKSTSFRGLRKVFFWEKKTFFQGLPVLLSPLHCSLHISLWTVITRIHLWQKYLLLGIKNVVFGQKEISFLGLPNFILSSAASISLWAVIRRIVIVNENKVASISILCWLF